MPTVFAYGSNMHLPDLRRWARESQNGHVHIESTEVGILPDFELTWNYYSHARRGGAANVMEKIGSHVYGVLLEVDQQTLKLIDRKEGHPDRYTRSPSPRPIIRRRDRVVIHAWVYEVTDAYRRDKIIPPQPEYLDLIIEAAESFLFPGHVLNDLRVTRAHLTEMDGSPLE